MTLVRGNVCSTALVFGKIGLGSIKSTVMNKPLKSTSSNAIYDSLFWFSGRKNSKAFSDSVIDQIDYKIPKYHMKLRFSGENYGSGAQ